MNREEFNELSTSQQEYWLELLSMMPSPKNWENCSVLPQTQLLIKACEEGNVGKAAFALSQGGEIRQIGLTKGFYKDCLVLAVQKGNFELVKLLLEAESKQNQFQLIDIPALHQALIDSYTSESPDQLEIEALILRDDKVRSCAKELFEDLERKRIPGYPTTNPDVLRQWEAAHYFRSRDSNAPHIVEALTKAI